MTDQIAQPGRPRGGTKHVVARAADIPEGGRILVDLDGRSVGVFRIDGEFYALLNRCPHHSGPLCKGELLSLIESDAPGSFRFDEHSKLLACPWHGWEFDVRTGQSWFDPVRTRARPFPVTVEHGGAIPKESAGTGPGGRLPGPFTAETLAASVEDEYVVVTMPPRRPGPSRDD